MPSAQKLLVVDDDVSFVGFVTAALGKLEVRSEAALSGADALTRLARHQYSGVLLDLKLPDIPGIEVLRALRRVGDGVPVVVVTGAGNVPVAVEAMRLGALHFLEKPVRWSDLSAVVSAMRPTGPPVHRPTSIADDIARAMVVVVRHSTDVPTVQAWCKLVGRSRSSLYALCELVGVAPKAALDLARLLRASRALPGEGLHDVLLSADRRTVDRLCARAGGVQSVAALRREDLLKNQCLVTSDRVMESLARHLESEG